MQKTIADRKRNAFRILPPSLSAIFAVVTGALALGLLVFLLRQAQGQPIDLALQSLRLQQLDAAVELDATLNQDFERARLALDGESKDVAELRDKLAVVRESLRRGFTEPDADRVLDSALERFLGTADEKYRLSGELQAGLRGLMERFIAMRQQSDAVLTTLLSSSTAPLRRSVMALVSTATTYCIQAAPANGADLERLLSDVRSGAEQLPDADRRQLLQLVSSTQDLRAYKDDWQRRFNGFRAIAMAAASQQLRDAFLANSRGLELRRERSRIILAVYAGALFVAFAVLALRLRRSFGELDQANTQLQQANETLEQGIAERTRDLSKALEDLRLQQTHLIQSEKMASLGQLVAGIAHEINTPLGYARGNVQTVREVLASLGSAQGAATESLGDADVLLGDAEYGLERITELVLSLKDFSRIDRSRTEPFNVNDCLEAALKICHNQLKDRIEVKRDYGALPAIPCAPSQLNQVFLNLITNALQAIDGTGTISISTRYQGTRVEVRIGDTGCGISPDVQAHIFEPFFTTKPVGKGTGLGLSIVYRIIEDHGGSIGVSSSPGVGTEFSISLPTSSAAHRAGSPEEAVVVIGAAT